MKIAFINVYQNKVNRGAETFVYELSKRLSKNHEVDILTEINVFELFRKRYDIIIPTNGRFQAALVRKITWLYGGKVVISGQSGIGFDDRVNLYTFPNCFVALTDFQLAWARKINPFVRVVKIPNGVDLKMKKMGNLSINLPKPIILAVGALEKNKRHDLTIKAVAKMNKGSLLVVGKGTNEMDLQKMGDKYLGKRFKIMALPYNEMSRAYQVASVFAFPTVAWESFGIVLVEAMASGLPVVASDDPIRREIVGDAGLFVDTTNTGEYANALKKALESNWGDKPKRQAAKFEWDKIAQSYEKLFRELTK